MNRHKKRILNLLLITLMLAIMMVAKSSYYFLPWLLLPLALAAGLYALTVYANYRNRKDAEFYRRQRASVKNKL